MKFSRFILLLIVMICFAIIFFILITYGLSNENDSYLLKRPLSKFITDKAGNIAVKSDTIMLE
ncbi:unnamed protein product, partial [Onchocerca ochengi]|uniref:Penicillin-binding protein n=1 Tax=Onchocerca ochengi TaxID=42157 RepID=A0A182EPC0_ONCOC